MALSGQIVNFFRENSTDQTYHGREVRDVSEVQMKLVLVRCACAMVMIIGGDL